LNKNNSPALRTVKKYSLLIILALFMIIVCFVIKDVLRPTREMGYLIYGFIGLMSMVILVALYQLVRFIILPYNRLYQGIYEIGLDKYPVSPELSNEKGLTPMVTEISEMFAKINDLISLVENMNNNASFMDTLNYINKTFSDFIPYNYIGIALMDDNKRRLRASYGVSDGTIVGLPDRIIGATWLIEDTSLGKLIDTGEVRIINDLEKHTAGKPLKPYNKVMLEAGVRSSITLPLKVSGDPMGVIFFSSSRKNVYHKDQLNLLNTLANSIAISLNQNIFVNNLMYSSILALAKLAEARDEDTGEHLDRMKTYSKVITELLYETKRYSEEIDLEYIYWIERYSPLHDIGKVGIPDGILLKPGKLTSEEFDKMKQHTLYGASVLRAAEHNIKEHGKSLFGMGIEIAEGHHEKWDGSGYPYGKKCLEIPLSARIVAVADVFDALTSRRPYKEPFSLEESLRIIEEGKGKHFDPVIVDTFVENLDRMKEVYRSFHNI